ncbi:NifB/NifX family molybdenum-iron cluster-binding protein [Aeromonas enteropelogenes]|uniref:NifB/NifX family molybdenum-iron cluster-binding protein n=1 Tax=Aeromonas enteropelogenes TaxID=29489 RepID=UPI003B9F96E9
MNHETTPGNSAIMLSQGLLAGHFSRAEQLQILGPDGAVLTTLANPAATAGCGGKQALLATLAEHGVDQVMVRNIGQQMLGRLLATGIRVMQCRSGRLPLPALLAPTNLIPLTEASQGRPSRHHQGAPSIHGIRPAGQQSGVHACRRNSGAAHGHCRNTQNKGRGVDHPCSHHKEGKSCQSGC